MLTEEEAFAWLSGQPAGDCCEGDGLSREGATKWVVVLGALGLMIGAPALAIVRSMAVVRHTFFQNREEIKWNVKT
jgi:hypothetical protein